MPFQMRFRILSTLLLSLIVPAGSASANMRFNFENCYNQNILHIGTRPPFGTDSKRVPACRTCDALFPAHSSKFRVIFPSAASRITALAALLLAL